MSDWYGTSRSNYFNVLQEKQEEFEKFCKDHCLTIMRETKDKQPTGRVGINAANSDKGSWPSYDLETDTEFDIVDKLQDFITPDSVVILMESGAEKTRYVTGYAISFNKKRVIKEISINDIYRETAKKLKIPQANISTAEY